MNVLAVWSGSKLSALLSTLAALIIVVATFWQWWNISVDGAMKMRGWVRVVLLIVAVTLVVSAVVLLASTR